MTFDLFLFCCSLSGIEARTFGWDKTFPALQIISDTAAP